MGIRKEYTKPEKIKKEIQRLNKVYKELDQKKKEVAEGLIERAAHTRITIEEFAKDLDENGYTEKFSQGEQEPYDRKRPIADLYNTMNTNYQKIIKQLTDLLPKDVIKVENKQPVDDFMDFVNGKNK